MYVIKVADIQMINMKTEILKTVDVVKSFHTSPVLNGVNITIHRGDIYGLVGRNGAGKSTLMNIISSLSIKDSGKVYLFGEDIEKSRDTKNRMGCMIESPAFYPNLSAYENLEYYCILKGIIDKSKINEVLEKVKLDTVGKKKFKQFSLGMKQRLGIALAILNNPDFIILDEPINGLDPLGIREIRETLLQLQQENITILISSHILSELYLVANKFGILEGGTIVKELTKEQLDLDCSRCLCIKVNDIKKASVLIEDTLQTTNYKVIDDKEIRIYEHLDKAHIISKMLVENGIDLYMMSELAISLEDYFKTMIKEDN